MFFCFVSGGDFVFLFMRDIHVRSVCGRLTMFGHGVPDVAKHMLMLSLLS